MTNTNKPIEIVGDICMYGCLANFAYHANGQDRDGNIVKVSGGWNQDGTIAKRKLDSLTAALFDACGTLFDKGVRGFVVVLDPEGKFKAIVNVAHPTWYGSLVWVTAMEEFPFPVVFGDTGV